MKGDNTVLDRIVNRCVEDLFAAYNIGLTPMPPPDPIDSSDYTYMGLIGFTGESMRGTLLLAPAALAISNAAWQTRQELRDWVGELANQLLGRIKNQLLRYGVEIYLTMPITIRGTHLAPVSRGELRPYAFDAAPGTVAVWLDAECVEGLTFTLKADTEHHEEGEAILF